MGQLRWTSFFASGQLLTVLLHAYRFPRVYDDSTDGYLES